MKTLQNKTVLLTGAAAGIGRELAIQLAQEGCHLYLVDVDQDGLNQLRQQLEVSTGRIWTRKCDLSRPHEVDAMLADFDEQADVIDILINIIII